MKIKISEAEGVVLDYLVAKCEGISLEEFLAAQTSAGCEYAYTTDWAQGGPLIERMFRDGLEMLQGEATAGNQRAWARLRDGKYYSHESSPLIAAMRCYVASKLGEEVEVPEELGGGRLIIKTAEEGDE